jgi:hypothetical protein
VLLLDRSNWRQVPSPSIERSFAAANDLSKRRVIEFEPDAAPASRASCDLGQAGEGGILLIDENRAGPDQDRTVASCS